MYDNRPVETKYIYRDDDSDGKQLDGRNTYAVTFAKGQVPPVKGFWSLTLYELPDMLLSGNPLHRYLINSPMLPGLKHDADGAMTFFVQHESPGLSKEPNWLPAPSGNFSIWLRAYWPDQTVLDGT